MYAIQAATIISLLSAVRSVCYAQHFHELNKIKEPLFSGGVTAVPLIHTEVLR